MASRLRTNGLFVGVDIGRKANGPELRQYIITSNDEELPFSRGCPREPRHDEMYPLPCAQVLGGPRGRRAVLSERHVDRRLGLDLDRPRGGEPELGRH